MTRTGKCLCGAVTFTGKGTLRGVEICHCADCRRHGAGPLMSARFTDGIEMHGTALSWFRSSQWAERGFCATCGTTLFWRMQDEPGAAFNVHALDDGTGLVIAEHIFSDDKPDWYDFADETPRIKKAESLEQLAAYLKGKSDV